MQEFVKKPNRSCVGCKSVWAKSARGRAWIAAGSGSRVLVRSRSKRQQFWLWGSSKVFDGDCSVQGRHGTSRAAALASTGGGTVGLVVVGMKDSWWLWDSLWRVFHRCVFAASMRKDGEAWRPGDGRHRERVGRALQRWQHSKERRSREGEMWRRRGRVGCLYRASVLKFN